MSIQSSSSSHEDRSETSETLATDATSGLRSRSRLAMGGHRSMAAAASWQGVPDSFLDLPMSEPPMPATAGEPTETPSSEATPIANAPMATSGDDVTVELDSAEALTAQETGPAGGHELEDESTSEGVIFDSWQVLAPLACGKGVHVWSVIPTGQTEAEAARYVVKQAQAESPLGRRLVRQEIVALSSVSSPHIVPLLDFRMGGDRPFLVVPQLPLPVTTHKLNQPMDSRQLARLLNVARQVALALHALHTSGWVHGDIAPRHISVSDAMHVTLFDLGLARAIHAGPQEDRDTWHHCVTGSLETLAPEAFDPHHPVTPERDCYALGTTVAWWLGGTPPWTVKSSATWEAIHRTQTPNFSPLHRVGYPMELLRLLERMLAKQPLRRPELTEVAELMLDLEIEHFGHWCPPNAA
ncbi:MAG: protein kinase [Planctomycetales bacterium]|nr:protein kinase [Planctomycetales bacterium]